MCPLIGIRRPTHSNRGTASGVARRHPVRVDAVVHDLKALSVEALDVLEVAREPARDRDVHVGEAREGAVRDPEIRRLAELVESVLGREPQRDARSGAREQTVRVGVDEMRVEDLGPDAREVGGQAEERNRIDVGTERNRIERDASRSERGREIPRAGLVLVEHQHPHVPAAVAEPRQQRQEMRLGPGDAGDLLQVENDVTLHRRPTVATTASAQCSTE